jgi:diguanylate cyclase (GGDEF)-like protein
MPLVRQITNAVPRLNHQLAIWLLTALVLAAVWLHTFRLIRDDHSEAKAAAESEIVNLARASQEHAQRIFYGADQTLRLVRSEFGEQEHAGRLDLQEMRAKGVFDEETILQVSIIDAQGILQFSSEPVNGRVDLSDRDYFKAHTAANQDSLFISRPERSSVPGRWSMQLSRRITGRHGEFSGVAVASLDPDYFTRFYAELNIGQTGVAALYELNGSLLARRSGGAKRFAGNAASEPVFALAAKGEKSGTLTYRSATDGVERIYHFKKLPSYPLLVLIGMASQDVFAQQQQARLHRFWEADLLSVLLLALAALASWYGVVRRRHVLLQQRALVQLQELTDNVPGLVFQYLLRADGSSCMPFASAGLRLLYHLNPEQVAQNAEAFFGLIHPDDLPAFRASIELSAQALNLWTHEYRVQFDDGTLRWHAGQAMPQHLPDGSVLWHGFILDVTDRKTALAEIDHLAFYDPLTDLPNRRLLADRLTQALAMRARSDHQGCGALLFVDIDNFKILNDTQGHEQGDLMLQQVARRLGYCLREGDTVAHFGGDDFVVMLQDLGDDLTEAASQAKLVGEKVLDALRQPYQLGGLTHHGSVSIGVALFKARNVTVEDLFKRADLALYQAKDAGRNTLRFFDPEIQATLSARATLEADLRLGIRDQQFLLYYQPQVDQHGRLVGVEALLRWQHPMRGMVSPAEFIPLAEDTGLILPLGQWVLETACGQLQQWASRVDAAHLTIAVNVSALQFRRTSFVSEVLAVISRTRAPATRLKLELTESLLVRDIDDIIDKMLALKAHGVGFSLDDFGTGYSSLSYLKRLPLDQIKIDQSFVRDAATNSRDAALVRATVAMGQGLGMMVIAEGVETQQQRDFLAQEGCLNYQGSLFGRPGPVRNLERFFSHD